MSNCITYWLPKLIDAGLPVPKTKIITTDAPLVMLLDGDKPDCWDIFLSELLEAVQEIGTPCFLRTGHTSNKHEWKDTCYIAEADAKLLGRHVYNLAEFSEICDFMGRPYDVWAVRELLPTTPAFHAFPGRMPIVREFRLFVRDSRVLCWHPYWPPDTILDASVDGWERRLTDMNQLGHEELQHISILAGQAGEAVGGDWSVDLLETSRGWFITDMAEAANSFHWPGCRWGQELKEAPA